MAEGWDAIPSDTLGEILLRLLPTPRRRVRLVCRHWRRVIDEHMPARQARAKVLAYISDQGSGSSRRPHAYVFDDLIEGRGRELELPAAAAPAPPSRRWWAWEFYQREHEPTRMVGTCNGLICLCRGRGEIVLFNPVTGEELAVAPPPPLPPGAAGSWRDEAAAAADGFFCFGYHPATGMYKILYVPRRPDEAFNVVQVFTLEEASSPPMQPPSWREVPAPGSSCRFGLGIVTVRGVAYWVAKDGRRVMAFDLEDERAKFAAELMPVPMPSVPWLRYTCRLADAGGRLGFTVCRNNHPMTSNTEVFVLEGGGGEEQVWVRRYIVLVNADQKQELASPVVAHGEHILTVADDEKVAALYAHRPREDRALRCGVVPVTARSPGTPVGVYDDDSYNIQTFSYVETTEPLLVYSRQHGAFASY